MNGPVNAKCYSLGLSSLVNDLVNVNSLWNGPWNNYVTRLFRSSTVCDLMNDLVNMMNDLLNSL